ncbi:MaoC family dehydratase [Elioraea sp.]|jgi:3-hydroxybutyryl-CoA dehydratase|uniref:MaoC family dehydratase n=1 Tax=Elioraea sp. TaxID=2185103 RepID=UPI003F6E9062
MSGAAGNGFIHFEDLSEGMSASFSRTVTESDIVLFAGVSGDMNPVHLDAEYAEKTVFKGRIAHGMLSAAFISTVLGTKLPGPGTVYLAQSLKFKAPVRIGDTVTATCEVVSLDAEKKRATLRTVCTVGGKPVVEGEALVMVPSRVAVVPKAAAAA